MLSSLFLITLINVLFNSRIHIYLLSFFMIWLKEVKKKRVRNFQGACMSEERRMKSEIKPNFYHFSISFCRLVCLCGSWACLLTNFIHACVVRHWVFCKVDKSKLFIILTHFNIQLIWNFCTKINLIWKFMRLYIVQFWRIKSRIKIEKN